MQHIHICDHHDEPCGTLVGYHAPRGRRYWYIPFWVYHRSYVAKLPQIGFELIIMAPPGQEVGDPPGEHSIWKAFHNPTLLHLLPGYVPKVT